MSGPEFNPADERPIDREEWEKSMSTQPENPVSTQKPAEGPTTSLPPSPVDGFELLEIAVLWKNGARDHVTITHTPVNDAPQTVVRGRSMSSVLKALGQFFDHEFTIALPGCSYPSCSAANRGKRMAGAD